MLKFILGLALCAALLVGNASGQSAAKRLPVPTQDELAEAKKLVGEVYRDEYAKAKTLEQKLTLVARLLSDAQKTTSDPAGKYAMLMVAADISASAGDWEATLAAIEQIAQRYDVDALELTDELRGKIEDAAKPSRDPKAAFFVVLGAIERAVAKDRYDVAERLAVSARKLARRIPDAPSAKHCADLVPNLQKIKRQFDELKSALETLAKDPADADANFAVGSFRCFVQGRWEEGISMLALGSNEGMAKAAEHELKQPYVDAEMLAVADSWWNLSETNKEYARELQMHAIDRYLRVLPRLEGLAKKKVESRLAASEAWLSKDAVYRVSMLHPGEPPLASLLNATERFYGEQNSQYAFQIGQADAFIVIDLRRTAPISRIYIQNRPVNDRTRGVGVYLSESPDQRGTLVWTAPDNAAEYHIVLPKLSTARYITIARDPNVNGGDGWLHLRKVKVFGPE